MKKSIKKFMSLSLLLAILIGVSACQKEEKSSNSTDTGKETTGQDSSVSTNSPTSDSAAQPAKQDKSDFPLVFIEGGFYGLKDASGNVLAEAKYDYISEQIDSDRVLVVKEQKWGYLDKDGKEVISLSYERAFPFADGLAQVMIDGKYGFINTNNEVIIPAEYPQALNLRGGFAKAEVGDNQWVLFDSHGTKLSSYENIFYFTEGRAEFQKDGKYGFLDESGKEVIPAIYEKADAFTESLSAVKKDGKYGAIDKSGKELLPFEYSSLQIDGADQIWFVKDNEWGMMKADGTVVIPGDYAFYESFEGDVKIAPFSKEGDTFGFIDKNGKQVTDFIYEYGTTRVSEGAAAVLKDGLWGMIDGEGKEILPPSMDYEEIFSFSQGLALVSKDNKVGYIDKQGKVVIPLIYDYPGETFEENGIASVRLNGKSGCIDTKGNLVVPAIYDNIPSFHGRVVSVTSNELNGCVDMTGKELIPVIYEKPFYFFDGIAEMEKDGRKLLFSEMGHILYQEK